MATPLFTLIYGTKEQREARERVGAKA
jgi:hypothetical protein